MEYTRQDIEEEKDYEKLKEMAKALEAETEVNIPLNKKKPVLRAKCLEVYDAHFKKAEEEKTEESEPEPEPEEEEVEEPEEELYVAPHGYADWASGWSYDPRFDKPKPLPDKLTPGLKNALKTKKIIRYEGEE